MTSISVAQKTQRSQSQSQVKRPAMSAYGLARSTRDGTWVITSRDGRVDKLVSASKRHDGIDAMN